MIAEELPVVRIRDDFYRDGFGKLLFVMFGLLLGILSVCGLSLYLYLSKPLPVSFTVGKEWRVQPLVPLNKPHLSWPDLAQWTTNTLSKVLVFDFMNYNAQLSSYKPYFTEQGWKVFLNQLNIYANYNNVLKGKLFLTGTPVAAPSLINQSFLLTSPFAWWLIRFPVNINYVTYNKNYFQKLTLGVLVVRVSTLNNLDGVAIDNIEVYDHSGIQQANG